MSQDLKPDPSQIGGIAQPPLAILPDPAAVFSRRAQRLEHLATESRLAAYLIFLAALSRMQADLVATLPPVSKVPPEQVAMARQGAMPPIDRASLAWAPELHLVLDAVIEAARDIAMPDPARAALEGLALADTPTRAEVLANVLSDAIPADAAAPHLWAAAAVQVHLTRLAATLDARRLVPVGTGACPSCGGRPAVSAVVGGIRAEGARYACCATCATRWNEVRVKCLCCGSTKGIGYRGLAEDAVIKAEVCDTCHSWVKILYQVKDAALDPLADDVASLGLDARMRDSEWARGGFNPWLVGF